MSLIAHVFNILSLLAFAGCLLSADTERSAWYWRLAVLMVLWAILLR